jgi:hypothetical protein
MPPRDAQLDQLNGRRKYNETERLRYMPAFVSKPKRQPGKQKYAEMLGVVRDWSDWTILRGHYGQYDNGEKQKPRGNLKKPFHLLSQELQIIFQSNLLPSAAAIRDLPKSEDKQTPRAQPRGGIDSTEIIKERSRRAREALSSLTSNKAQTGQTYQHHRPS